MHQQMYGLVRIYRLSIQERFFLTLLQIRRYFFFFFLQQMKFHLKGQMGGISSGMYKNRSYQVLENIL